MINLFKINILHQEEGIVTLQIIYNDKFTDCITLPINELYIILDKWYSENGPQ
jgi:hypothetical protein